MKHGDPLGPTTFTDFFGDDPDLAMVNADMEAWQEAHPCYALEAEDEWDCEARRGHCPCLGGDDE